MFYILMNGAKRRMNHIEVDCIHALNGPIQEINKAEDCTTNSQSIMRVCVFSHTDGEKQNRVKIRFKLLGMLCQKRVFLTLVQSYVQNAYQLLFGRLSQWSCACTVSQNIFKGTQ